MEIPQGAMDIINSDEQMARLEQQVSDMQEKLAEGGAQMSRREAANLLRWLGRTGEMEHIALITFGRQA